MVDSFADLIERVRNFDLDALTSVYDQHSPGIYRYAMRMLGDLTLAEDCTAETFHRLLNSLRSARGPRDNLKAYLFRIAHNWITDYYRTKLNHNVPLQDSIMDCEPELGLVIQEKIEQSRVRYGLLSLTPDQRQVILLKFYEGWENDEIAAALKKPVGAVKALQHRAIRQLKKYFRIANETKV